ncbi:NTP transferase domain-containing protein [Candidatus Babeliales bacterium]|nr:NTP transferase domain-containing protein [Candidatus Babeliales bacterium]
MTTVYAGIMAGGVGTRLWPLSNKSRPKQLIPFLNNSSLLDQAIERVMSVATAPETIFVVTSNEQEALINNAVGNSIGFVVSEPEGRNTAPALLLGCYRVFQKDPEAVIIFLPADHFIPDVQAFTAIVNQAVAYVAVHNKIALFGLKPRSAAIGYGYIQTNPTSQNDGCFSVAQFHEKPTLALAQAYAQRDDMLWNMGIFVAKASTFLQEFKTCAPMLSLAMQAYLSGTCAYADLENISVDYAVMEKSCNTVVFAADLEWYDVGNVYTFLQLKETYAHDNVAVINVDATGNMAYSKKKFVACIGVDDLCIIETDDALLIVKKDKAELVKQVSVKINELTL